MINNKYKNNKKKKIYIDQSLINYDISNYKINGKGNRIMKNDLTFIIKTCDRYTMREIKMAEEEFKFNQEQNFKDFKERCSKAISKE